MIVTMIWVPDLSVAGEARHDYAGAAQPYSTCSARNKILSAVLAHSVLQMGGDAYPMPHSNPFCQIYVAVTQLGTCIRHRFCKLEEPLDLLARNLFNPSLPVFSGHWWFAIQWFLCVWCSDPAFDMTRWCHNTTELSDRQGILAFASDGSGFWNYSGSN